MLPTFNVITCRRCGRSFMAPSPRYRFCPGCQKEKRRRTDAASRATSARAGQARPRLRPLG